MSQSILLRDLALGIGLAARALPDTAPKQLIDSLVKGLGLPLTVSKLQSLTPSHYKKMLKKGLQKNVSNAELDRSLSHLQALELKSEHPELKDYRSGDIPYSIRLAVASDDGLSVNDQFSTCKRFYIYQVSWRKQQLIDVREVGVDGTLRAEQKQQYRAELIKDCHVLYCLTIGGQAAAKVVKQGVHPMKLKSAAIIADIIEQLQHVLLLPPPWLAKSMSAEAS